MELRPQPGPQERFAQSRADIAIYGGSAGSGKSFALILEPLFNVSNGQFRAVCFRRTVPQIKLQGGLWEASQIYATLGAVPNVTALEWRFPSGATVKFSGLEHEDDRFAWQGAQVPLIMWDELVHFSAQQFWYLTSRCRSMSGVKGYIRAATNPGDPDSWVRGFIEWWIDADTGLAISSRSGVWRWFIRLGDELVWSDNPHELVKRFGPDSAPKSVTFIPAKVLDNKILMAQDPDYLANLKALPRTDRERLLNGNWNVRATAGSYFRREFFSLVEAPPADVVGRVRFWDRAATEKRSDNDPDATVGLRLSRDRAGFYYVEDVRKMFASPGAVEKAMRACAEQDPRGTVVAYMQDPGSAGVAEAQATARALDGFNVRFAPATGDKQTRAKPIASQSEAGNVKLVRGPWTDSFIRIVENFPMGSHDDEVDALSGAYENLAVRTPIWLA